MGFSIDYGFGFLGGVVIAILISAGLIIAFFLFAAAKQARDTVVEEDEDRAARDGLDHSDGPIA